MINTFTNSSESSRKSSKICNAPDMQGRASTPEATNLVVAGRWDTVFHRMLHACAHCKLQKSAGGTSGLLQQLAKVCVA